MAMKSETLRLGRLSGMFWTFFAEEGVFVKAPAADNGTGEDDNTGNNDDDSSGAEINASSPEDANHSAFVAADTAGGRKECTNDAANAFGDGDLGENAGLTEGDGNNPVGCNFEKGVEHAPEARADDGLFVVAEDEPVFVKIGEVFVNFSTGEDAAFFAESDDFDETVDETAGNFCEPIDAAFAHDNNESGDDGDFYADSDEGGDPEYPFLTGDNTARDKDDDD